MKKNGPEKIEYAGKIIEVVHQPMLVGDKEVTFETARRSPGTRLIIQSEDKILLSREYRSELEDYDYRLPGGKVFDTLKEFNESDKDNLTTLAMEAAKKEGREETGLEITDLELITISKAGSTVAWDLYYFEVKSFSELQSGQELEDGEDITIQWVSIDDLKSLILRDKLKEDRSVGVLFKYLLRNDLI